MLKKYQTIAKQITFPFALVGETLNDLQEQIKALQEVTSSRSQMPLQVSLNWQFGS